MTKLSTLDWYVEDFLMAATRWRKPRVALLESWPDLFDGFVGIERVVKAFAVMAQCQESTFLVATDNMRQALKFLRHKDTEDWVRDEANEIFRALPDHVARRLEPVIDASGAPWPLNNVWFGARVRTQAELDASGKLLLEAPSTNHFILVDPMMGPLEIENGRKNRWSVPTDHDRHGNGIEWTDPGEWYVPFDWVIVRGKCSGREEDLIKLDLSWVRSLARQCLKARVPIFVDRLGAHVFDRPPVRMTEGSVGMLHGPFSRVRLRSKYGSVPGEWPEDVRFRQFPVLPGMKE